MPELPDVEIFKREAEKALGSLVSGVDIHDSHAMLKNFLMDQSEISGIGNVYSDEILFQAGIHPEKKSSRLSGTQAKDLYKQTLKVLETAVKKEADIDKLPEDYLLPNREAGEKCPHCSGKIKKIKISGRTGYYCPRCQTKK